MQELGIEALLLQAIRDGTKTIEGRLGKPRFLKIRPGDIILVREDTWAEGKLIASTSDAARIRVTQVLYFESFEEMFGSLSYKAAIPSAKSLEDALRLYRSFYTAEDEEEFGAIALLFNVHELRQSRHSLVKPGYSY